MSTIYPGGLNDTRKLDFDGHIEVVVPNTDVLNSLKQDDFITACKRLKGGLLFDKASVMQTIGYEEVHIEDGKAVEVSTPSKSWFEEKQA